MPMNVADGCKEDGKESNMNSTDVTAKVKTREESMYKLLFMFVIHMQRH